MKLENAMTSIRRAVALWSELRWVLQVSHMGDDWVTMAGFNAEHIAVGYVLNQPDENLALEKWSYRVMDVHTGKVVWKLGEQKS